MARLLALAIAIAIALMAAFAAAHPETKYTNRFDSIDLDRVLASRRLVNYYADCLLGQRRCPPDGAELKRVLPEALATRCAKCSTEQRDAAMRVIQQLRQKYPDIWAKLQEKWDPTGAHTKHLEMAVARRRAAGSQPQPLGVARIAHAKEIASAGNPSPVAHRRFRRERQGATGNARRWYHFWKPIKTAHAVETYI